MTAIATTTKIIMAIVIVMLAIMCTKRRTRIRKY